MGVYAIAALIILGFHELTSQGSHSQFYMSLTRDRLLHFYPFIFYVQRIWFIVTGIDWGLIYTAPFILIALGSAVFLKYPLRRVILLSLLPLLMNLYLVICWKSQAGWYGYRYFVPLAVPLFIYPLALILEKADNAFGRRKVLIAVLLISVVPVLSMLAFEGNSSGLTLTNAMEYFGEADWGNNTYQWNIWKMLIKQPVALMGVIFKGGAVYVVYCLKVLMQRRYCSPSTFFQVFLLDSLGLSCGILGCLLLSAVVSK